MVVRWRYHTGGFSQIDRPEANCFPTGPGSPLAAFLRPPYLHLEIHIQFDPKQLSEICKVGRKLTQENIQIPVDDKHPKNKPASADCSLL
jgi:hypothetical protein